MKTIYSRSNTTETGDVCSKIVQLGVDKPIIDDSHFDSIFSKIKFKTNRFLEEYNSERLSVGVSDADQLRDNDTKALFKEIEAKMYWREGLVRTSAANINEVLQRYGIDIIRLANADQTVQSWALHKDLKNLALRPHVLAVPMFDELLTNFENSLIEFDKKDAAMRELRIGNVSTVSAYKLSVELFTIINKELIPYIMVMNKVNPATYSTFATNLEQIIEDNNYKVHNRIALVEKKKEANKQPVE